MSARISLFVAPRQPRGEQEVAARGSPQVHQGPTDDLSFGSKAALTSCVLVGVLAAVGLSTRRRARPAESTALRAAAEGNMFEVIGDTDKYIELDRKAARPVFGYPDWKRQRSSARFFRNLGNIWSSSTIRANWQEVLVCTLSAAFVVAWNDYNPQILQALPDVVQPYLGFKLGLPALPFTMSSFALSLLLVFRTNQAYNRWWEARCIWGAIINTCRDIVRQALTRFDPRDDDLKEEVTRLVSAWPRSLIFHLGERTDLSVEVLEKKYGKILTKKEKDKLMACVHKPMTCTGMISDAIRKAKLDTIDEMKLDEDLSKFSDFYGMCERIFKTPIPLSYTRLTSRFLAVWMLFLPLALYGAVTPHVAIIPITAMLSYFIFAIEEVGIKLEEPFSQLPMNTMADGIDASIFEALELDKKRKELVH